MKLYYAAASPYARKVRILVEEIGLSDRVEVIAVNPWTDESLRKVNPLCKVPTLTTDEGRALYDSRVICIHLDRVAGSGLVTAAPTESLLMEALADGVCDAAVRRVREEKRSDGHADEVARQTQAIRTGLDEAERLLASGGAFDIGPMALVSCLGYLDFRLGVLAWREGRPKLAAWFEEIGRRPSVAGTIPA